MAGDHGWSKGKYIRIRRYRSREYNVPRMETWHEWGERRPIGQLRMFPVRRVPWALCVRQVGVVAPPRSIGGFQFWPPSEEAGRWIQQRARVQFSCDACNLPHLVLESLPSQKFLPPIYLVRLEVHFRCEVGYEESGYQWCDGVSRKKSTHFSSSCSANPPAVFSRLEHILHLKCWGFWCCIKTEQKISSKIQWAAVNHTNLYYPQIRVHSTSTMVGSPKRKSAYAPPY